MPQNETKFRKWYAGHASGLGLNPDPDAPQHHYDYRAAYRAGAKPDASGHWPSAHKRAGHPRLVIGGVDTRTGKSVMPTRKRMKPGTVARVKARMAADKKAEEAERARKRANRELEANMRERRAATAAKRKSPTPKTPEQIRSEAAAGRREKVEPSFLARLRKALGG